MRVQQKRLFWAINLPDELKRKFFGIQSWLREVPADVKWVEQHNLHLTVKFLGEVDAGLIDDITRAVEESVAGSGEFILEFADIGFFPGPQRPRVIWVGVRGEVQKFRLLHDRVEESMARLGFASEGARFSPHLTLGRLRSPRGARELVSKARAIAGESGVIGRVRVAAVDLVESRLTRTGPLYSVLATLKLLKV